MRVVLLALAALAASVSAQHQHVFAPGPLVHHDADVRTSSDFQPGNLYASQRLIKVSEQARARWMSLESIMVLRQAGVRFMDITDAQDLHEASSAVGFESTLPRELAQGAEVNKTLELLSTDLYGLVLEPFTAFHNRYYDSENGRKSSEWLQQQIESLVADAGANVTVTSVTHRFRQPSV
ncbi:Leucine aminopeptidase 1, partial [Coemansia erecta]